jgi:hypothetical protein
MQFTDCMNLIRKLCFDYKMPDVLSPISPDGCIWADAVDTAGSNTPGLHPKNMLCEKGHDLVCCVQR